MATPFFQSFVALMSSLNGSLVRINSSVHGWFPWLCYLLSTPALGLPTHRY
jgi:hypothetical protein